MSMSMGKIGMHMREKKKELSQIVTDKIGSKYLPENLSVFYNLQMNEKFNNVWGRANLRTQTIHLNSDFAKMYKLYYIKHVFTHEYAHLIVEKLYPNHIKNGKKINPHGLEFREVCSWFGIEGNATSNLDYLSRFHIDTKMIPYS